MEGEDGLGSVLVAICEFTGGGVALAGSDGEEDINDTGLGDDVDVGLAGSSYEEGLAGSSYEEDFIWTTDVGDASRDFTANLMVCGPTGVVVVGLTVGVRGVWCDLEITEAAEFAFELETNCTIACPGK